MFEHELSLLKRINSEMSKECASYVACDKFIPERLSIQWHITDRCNLNCTHCYLDSEKTHDMPLEKLRIIFNSYMDALNRMKIKGSIQITGGEPFIRNDLFELLEIINKHKDKCYYGIMSNGTMIDPATVNKLKKTGCRFIQVSIDGGEAAHDSIRGNGSFRETMESVRLLKKRGIPVSVSFTAGRKNYAAFTDAVMESSKAGADLIWSDRVIPTGRAELLSDELMNFNEVEDYFSIMNCCRKNKGKIFFRKTAISMGRALQFMYYDGDGFDQYPYRCSAGKTILTILSDGRVVPCRRMPVIIGDLNNSDLYTIYQKSTMLRMLRNPRIIPDGCGDCFYSQICNGGLKCLSYAVHGNPFTRDPQCTDAVIKNALNFKK